MAHNMFETLPSRQLLSTSFLNANFTADGRVNALDFDVMALHFSAGGDHSVGDPSRDGKVNAIDFNMLAAEFGSVATGKLIFSDEFVGSKNAAWTPSQYWWPDDHTVVGQGELESYDATGVSVSDGGLHLTARLETKYGEPYVSGLVQTGGKQDHPDQPRFSFLYGYME